MSSITKKNLNISLLNEVDDLIMEGWSEDMTIGEVLDSMPANLRNFFLNLRLNTPSIDTTEGTYTVTFNI